MGFTLKAGADMWFMSPGKPPALKPANPEKQDPPVENPTKIDQDRNKLLDDDGILDQHIISVSETKIFISGQDSFEGDNSVFFYHSG